MLVYPTAEHCAPVWCRSAHIRLTDSVSNEALCIVTGCLCPIPTDHLPTPSGIQPTELRRLGATSSLAKRGTPDPDYILHGQLAGSPDVPQERLKSRRPFVSAEWKLLNGLSKRAIHVTQWKNYKWSAKYSKRTSVLHAFISRASFRCFGVGLPRTSWQRFIKK